MKPSAAPQTSEPKKPRLASAERKAQILAAAREVFIERGIHGTRSSDIAERAGITEAYLYRKFHSKEEIYQLAIDEPLGQLTEQLRVEMRELAASEHVSRSAVLLRCHELVLGCVVGIAPLIGAALFWNLDNGKEFYSDYLFPKLRSALELIIPDITGRPIEHFAVDLFVETVIGIHLTIALDHLLREKAVDVADVSRQIVAMFAPSMPSRVGRSTQPTKSAQ